MPVDAPVPRECLRPAPDSHTLLLAHRHRPVGERDGGTLLQQAGVVLPPAVIAFERPVNTRVGPARELLQVLDGEFGPVGPLDRGEQVSLPPGQLGLLPARGSRELREDLVCR